MNKDEIEDLKDDIADIENDINLFFEEIRKKSVEISNLQGVIYELFDILKKKVELLDE